ncbi:MAG: AsmA family protein [Desulfovibrio sp.]|nr:AsmA family protein [Desulfovibrio sp.]
MSIDKAHSHPSKPARGSKSPLRFFIVWILLPFSLILASILTSLYLLCISKPDLVARTLEKHISAAVGLPVHIRGEVRPSLLPFPGLVATQLDIGPASEESAGSALVEIASVNIRLDPASLLDLAPRFSVSGTLGLPDADLTLDFFLEASLGRADSPAAGHLNGILGISPPGSRILKADFATDFALARDKKILELPNLTLHAEGDSLNATLQIDLETFESRGKVKVEHLSLPRWFGFGRVLPPGLRALLHNFTGEFDLLLNKDKAEAHNLKAQAGALRVHGYVGTPDFSAPAVVVQIELEDKPDLDTVFTFLGVAGRVIPDPVPPLFDHPSLAPYPANPASPAAPPVPAGEETTVGYDINIHLEEAILHGVSGGPIDVRVHPHLDKKGADKTRVDIKADNLLRGRADGVLDIDAGAILMRYEAFDMDLELLPENEDSNTRIAGTVNGVCEIDMPMREDGSIADDWPLRADAAIKNLDISGKFQGQPWHLLSKTAAGKGAGLIHAVLEEGVRIDGDWRIESANLRGSWHNKDDGAVKGSFSGSLLWPPIPGKAGAKNTRRSVERVKGKAALNGEMGIPLPDGTGPLKGNLNAEFDWNVHKDKLNLLKADFEGLGSYAQGAFSLDLSGQSTVFQAQTSFKTNPRELFKAWRIEIPSWISAPRLFSGRMEIYRDGSILRLENLRVEADSAPISGNISMRRVPGQTPQQTAKKEAAIQEVWTARLSAELLDLDNIFPPDPVPRSLQPTQAARTNPIRPVPSVKKTWDLSSMQNISLDIQFSARNLRKNKLTASDVQLTARLQNDRFSLYGGTGKFYGGSANISMQGTILPEASRLTLRKGTMQMGNVSLGRLLQDYTGEQSYAGEADLSVEAGGVLSGPDDFPSKLSGSWNLTIKNGQYPAFLSGPDSKLRNTFSLASASGPLDRGVLRSDNFTLSGPMVDMKGGGWYDLNTKDMNIEVSVTFAKVPTIPIRFHGNASAPLMNIRGADMVVDTVQAAGSGIFGLVRGVLSIPVWALSGIGSLFEDEGETQAPVRTRPREMPRTMELPQQRPAPVTAPAPKNQDKRESAPREPKAADASSGKNGDATVYNYVYQAGSYKDEAVCEKFTQQLRAAGFKARTAKSVSGDQVWFRTLIDFTGRPDDTNALRERLKQHGVARPILNGKTPAR